MAGKQVKFVVTKRTGGFIWVLLSRGKPIARSAKTWARKQDAKRSAEHVSRVAGGAPVVENGE